MKKVFTGFFLLIAFGAFAQTDSSTLNVSFVLKESDAAFLIASGFIDINSVHGEVFWEKVKSTSRGKGTSGNTNVPSDTVDAGFALQIPLQMRSQPFSLVYLHFENVVNALDKATGPGAPWLKRRILLMTMEHAAESGRRIQKGTGIIKKQ